MSFRVQVILGILLTLAVLVGALTHLPRQSPWALLLTLVIGGFSLTIQGLILWAEWGAVARHGSDIPQRDEVNHE